MFQTSKTEESNEAESTETKTEESTENGENTNQNAKTESDDTGNVYSLIDL